MKRRFRFLGLMAFVGILWGCSSTEKDQESKVNTPVVLDALGEAKNIFTKLTAKYDSVTVEETDSTLSFYAIPKTEEYDRDKELFGEFTIDKTKIIYGDLNNDGLEDVVLRYHYIPHLENSIAMYYKVLLQKEGKLVEETEIFGGARCEGPILDLISISKGIMHFEATEFASEDPCCCPSLKNKYSYKLENGKAVKVK